MLEREESQDRQKAAVCSFVKPAKPRRGHHTKFRVKSKL